MIVWVDLETTGTDTFADSILEIAAVVTDDQLNEVRRWQTVLPHFASKTIVAALDAGRPLEEISSQVNVVPYVLAMHDKNGLWVESCCDVFGDNWYSRRKIAGDVLAAIIRDATETVDGKPVPPQLGGSSVWFDRGFLDCDYPDVSKLLHHRQVDASTMNEMARRFWPVTYARRPRSEAAHRAMPDILQSIDLARYYANHLQAVAP